MKFINNDTIAIIFLGAVALCAIFFKMDTISTAALGALGGYLGSKGVEAVTGTKEE